MDGTLFGRYRLIELLGRGGMGEVWRAHDIVTDRTVAIKRLPAHFSENEEFQERFRREAHAAARLNTPHVIPIHDYGEIDGQLFVSMRLIEGRDLQTVLTVGPLDPVRAVRIIEGVAKALHAAHRVGLVHRDVKPSNVLVDDDDFAYLIDFGIARAAAETRLTSTGNVIGTFQYMAPERFGSGQEDARADIYALACVLYECLTGHPPFAENSAERLMMAHLSTPPPRPSSSQSSVPPQIDLVVATGMAKDPVQRYATTVELAAAARDAVTVPTARPTLSPAPMPPPRQPTTRPAIGTAAATQRRPDKQLPNYAGQPRSEGAARRPDDPAAHTIGPNRVEPPASRGGLTAQPPASRARRVGAVLIDLIPLVVIWAIGYGVAVLTARGSCYSEDFPNHANWNECTKNVSSLGTAVIIIAALIAFAFGMWNWAYRQGRKGSSIGQSVLKFGVVSTQNGQPPGVRVKRIVGAVLVAVVGSIAVKGLAHFTVYDTTTACLKSGGSYPGTYLVDYATCRDLGA